MHRRFFMGPLRDPEPQPAGGDIPGMPPPAGGEGDKSDPVTKLAADVAKMGQTLDRVVTGLRSQPVAAEPGPPKQPATDPKALETQFWKDPLNMTNAIAQHAVAQALQAQQAQNPAADTLVETAKKVARDRDPQIFDLLRPEIEAKVQAMPGPQFAQSSSVWNNAFNMAVGENIDRVLAERGKNKPAAPNTGGPATAGPSVPSPKAPAAPPETPLTDEEKTFIRKFGITEEGYKRGMKFRDGQNGKPDQPSSWDDYITFDSDQAKRKRAAAARKEGK